MKRFEEINKMYLATALIEFARSSMVRVALVFGDLEMIGILSSETEAVRRFEGQCQQRLNHCFSSSFESSQVTNHQ
jgi:hypothetical protein